MATNADLIAMLEKDAGVFQRAANALRGVAKTVPQAVQQVSHTPAAQTALTSAAHNMAQAVAPAVPNIPTAAARVGDIGRNLSRNLGRNLTIGAGAGALGYAGYKGLQGSNQTENDVQDLINARRHDMNSQMPPMYVYASYEQFAEDKLAAHGMLPMAPVMPTIGSAGAHALATSLSNSLVTQPLDALGSMLKKKFYDGPKHRATYDAVVKDDPELSKADPKMLNDVFSTMRKFGPSLAHDRNATRSFLRQGMMANGNLDYATIRMLAETEKFIQQGKGGGGR